MKGVVLAGGLGTRFDPVTRVVNKHLLDVFDEPMIHFPIKSLAEAGVRDIVLVTGREIEQFRRLLGNGEGLGVNISYVEQPGQRGIAHALQQAAPLVGNERVVVILGDNLYQDSLSPYIEAFAAQASGARLLLRRVSLEDARRFGVAKLSEGKIINIVEKPKDPDSDLVVTGCYMYDDRVFDLIPRLIPSQRGELEITDINNLYAESGDLEFDILRGWWTDAGTPPSKLKASLLVALEQGVTFHSS